VQRAVNTPRQDRSFVVHVAGGFSPVKSAQMVKGKRKTRIVRKPSWIADVEDQGQWTARFAQILTRHKTDPVISAILSNKWLPPRCAVKVRSYTDKSVTDYFYQERRLRGRMTKAKLETAIKGLNAAIELYTERGNQTVAMYLGGLAIELSAQLGRCGEAFATKRHGRDFDHSILLECRMYLEAALTRTVSNATLAHLINAADEVDGKTDKYTSEEQVRKNLHTFQQNNPTFMKLISRA